MNKGFMFWYFCLITSIFLSKIFPFFINISFLILCSPLVFMDLKKLGFKNLKKGFLYGLGFSLVYFPFIWGKVSYFSFFQLGQVLAEEIFFRGYLLNVIPIQNKVLRNVVVSFLFIIPHLVLNISIFSVLTFFPSLLFGYLFFKTGSIVAPVIFHFFSNLFFQTFITKLL
jgi:membrane protease YdiL (CAAX protease family)